MDLSKGSDLIAWAADMVLPSGVLEYNFLTPSCSSFKELIRSPPGTQWDSLNT